MTPGQYDDLVSSLYQAATGARPWHEVLQAVVDRFEGFFCQLVALDVRTGRMALTLHSSGSPMDGVLDYMREYHRIDPHVAHAAMLPPGTVFNTADLIPASQARVHPFYRQFWSVYGVRYMSGGKVSEDEDIAVYLGLFRSAAQGRFDAAGDALLKSLFTHLKEAFAIYRSYSRLAAQADSGRLVIDRSERPILLLGPDRFVVHANRAAQRLLQQAEVIVARSGYLGCGDPKAEEALSRALYGLNLEVGGTGTPERANRRAFALRSPQGDPVPACLWALRPTETMGAFGDTPRAMLLLPAAASQMQPDAVVLAASFGLTPAEGRVLANLAQVPDIRQAAQALGVSFHTARAHLRSIFSKTGVRTQKELLHKAHRIAEWG